MYKRCLNTPVGAVILTEENERITGLTFGHSNDADSTPLLDRAAQQLAEYFSGKRKNFTLPLLPEGTPFQKSVWMQLMNVPYGQTLSYSALAWFVGDESAARAVGAANHQNPIPILLPCHRVIGADGSLTGYVGGLDVKRALLDLEKKYK